MSVEVRWGFLGMLRSRPTGVAFQGIGATVEAGGRGGSRSNVTGY